MYTNDIGYITVYTNNIGYITVYTNNIGYITVYTNNIGYITVYTNNIGYITVYTNNIGYITVYTNNIGYITVYTNNIGYITVYTNNIGYITVVTNYITGRRDAKTRWLIRFIGCYDQRISLGDIRSKCHYSSINNVEIYFKILFFCNYKPYFEKIMKLNKRLPPSATQFDFFFKQRL